MDEGDWKTVDDKFIRLDGRVDDVIEQIDALRAWVGPRAGIAPRQAGVRDYMSGRWLRRAGTMFGR